MKLDYTRRPRVGDIIEIGVGPVRVTAVHDHGRRLEVVDRLGRAWQPERAEVGTWVRRYRAAEVTGPQLAELGLTPVPSTPAAREKVTTWANGWGNWHARVTFPDPGYGPAHLAGEMDRIRAKARRAIRREILARSAEGANIGEVRVKLVDRVVDPHGRTRSVTFRETDLP